MNTFTSFTKYFNKFYGANGVYPNTSSVNISEETIVNTIVAIARKNPDYEFKGDSMDREMVRDYLIDAGKIEIDYDSAPDETLKTYNAITKRGLRKGYIATNKSKNKAEAIKKFEADGEEIIQISTGIFCI